ncbi:MAG TPA: hypothetical protein EYN93_10620 [Planctomycetaceae bacterium]|nr:hypothetical protein [Planctomycetaceae bacterium]
MNLRSFQISRRWLIVVWACSFCLASNVSVAQEGQAAAAEQAETETTVREKKPPRKPLTEPVVQRIGVTSGFGSFVPSRWGILSAEVWNPTDREQKMSIKANWETDNPADNAVQFTRTFIVPSMTRRIVWYPIRVPDHKPENERLRFGRLMLRSIISRQEGGTEVMVVSPLQKVHAAAQINTEFNKPAMGYIPEDESATIEMRDYLAKRGVDVEDISSITLRMLTSIRQAKKLGTVMFTPKLSGIAPSSLSLDSLDQLVIADGRYSEDVSLTNSIRSWIMGGGRAWIMLDRTGTAFARRLLGDSLNLVELETRELTTVVVTSIARGQRLVGSQNKYDTPVRMINVMVDGVEVTHEVGDIPAAFWMKYGNGEILFTTLSSEAWVRNRTHPAISRDLLALEPLEDLMNRFFTPSEKALTDFAVTATEKKSMVVKNSDDLQTVADKNKRLAQYTATSKVKDIDSFLKLKIGFQIVSRGHIIAVFAVFCGAIIAMGFFLHRKGRLELILAGAPVIVIVLSSYLYAVGAAKRSSLENLVGSVQFINAEHGSRDIVIRGIGAVYNKESVADDIAVTGGGVFWPDMTELIGTNIRMVWTDMDEWHWEGLMMPGGTVRSYPFEKPLRLEDSMVATATLTAAGLVGSYQLPGLNDIDHAMLVSPLGERSSVELVDGKLRVFNTQLSNSEIDATTPVMDGEAIRRLEFVNSLLSRNENQTVTFPSRYTLLVWSSPLDLGFAFPGDQNKIGSALTAIPLHVENTKPETRFVVPSIYQQYDVVSANGIGASVAYDNVKGKWVREPHNSQHQFWIRTKVPPSVLPAKITKATVLMDISAGGRPVNSVGGSFDDEGRIIPEILATIQSPNAAIEFVIDDVTYLTVDQHGYLYLGFNIGLDPIEGETREAMRARDTNYSWFIRDVDISLEGETLARP